MKCPFCLIEYHDNNNLIAQYSDKDGNWELIKRVCPACQKANLTLENVSYLHRNNTIDGYDRILHGSALIYPHGASRSLCPIQVPKQFADDYNEACLVLNDSPKASAALSRRCLQLLLREEVKVKPNNLSHEIQEVLDNGKLPTLLANSIDAIRNIGNFAAHPLKSEKSGEIVDVEPGEAEWLLDVLESLFDYYFVQPETLATKRAILNQKLVDLGKPPMK
jgi:hypothetical protein